MTTLTAQHIHLVRTSWAAAAPSASAVAALFYGNLFMRDPQLKPLFKGDMAAQGAKLMDMIGAAVGLLDRPATLMPVLRSLGHRHQAYGVRDAHYEVVGAALLQTLQDGLAEAFTPDVREAWTAVYGVLSAEMKAGAPAPAASASRPLMAAAAVVLACSAALPVQAQPVGWHPATAARPVVVTVAGIDPNTFIVGHPASPTVRGGHANVEHPAVRVARRAVRLDANTFLVQPPAQVTWRVAPPAATTTATMAGDTSVPSASSVFAAGGVIDGAAAAPSF